jgi:lipopolysaccharide biosynthesis glycosyltransferase
VNGLQIACAAEGRYLAHSAAMLHSVLAGGSARGAVVHYLHDPALPERRRRDLAGMVEGLGASIDFLPIPDQRLAGLPTRGFTRKATWYRIFLPELLPDVDRILYLDSDLIALADLRPLWETDVDDLYLAAATNVLEPHYADRLREAGFDPRSYFNAGVMLLNLDLMRRDGCSAALRAYGVEHEGDLVLRDQDALNAVLGGRRLALHPRWNCMNAYFVFPWSVDAFGAERLAEALADPAIRHFEGPGSNKPWHYLGDREGRRAYDAHRRQTPWPRYWPAGVSPRNVGRRLERAVGREGGFAPAPLRDRGALNA